ncbi:MAG: hypothetical protein A3F40_05070 [Chlamydiae bacterium RIFCSPHIGHO2_12_FULL_27_8]|nr:MAG: hypothetical protein A3F40_05070 [Chlamydiae bacterium RIFCSPHIGHO2_12_FULL_27_8]OGN66819.1 MAG: hypothetical protein A2888_00615 [Chlamydiae bacterium RIFCSPLOWO2_01_FULL_28_7]
MKRFFFLTILFFAIYSNDLDTEKHISSFKQTLLKKGIKLLNKTKNSDDKNNELIVDLRNPSYKNGILITHEGGVIKGSDIRIQAKTIQYIKRMENNILVHKIEAEGDLLIQYKGKVYVGDELEYDFITKTGIVYSGKTYASLWYLGGDKIKLNSDGTYLVENVFITTCENVDSTWDLHAGRVEVLKKDLLQAKSVKFRFFNLPTLWLPSFKVNLKRFISSPSVRYNVNWDKSSGPRGTLRYRLYSWKDFALWGRLEYRLRIGWGGAVETEYHPENSSTILDTKNYLATDIIEKDLHRKRRYRIQGKYFSKSPSNKTTALLTWDKFSDINMPSDFKSDDFEISTQKKSELNIRHVEKSMIGILYASPRVNDFDSVKQNLPTGYLYIKPVNIPKVDIISYNFFKASYLNFVYSDKLSPSLNDFESQRFETKNIFSKAFKNNFLCLNPYIGFNGIFYNKSPNKSSKYQALMLYGGSFTIDFYKKYNLHKHVIEPYVLYEGISKPNSAIDTYYIFSIEDGKNTLHLLKTGIKNSIYSLKHLRGFATFDIDLYANIFFDEKFTLKALPKLYLDVDWKLPSVSVNLYSAYNFANKTLDYSNIKFGWTINEYVALSLGFRYRSSYDFRKANHENFILDVSRDIFELKQSSISDKRNTILGHIYFRLNPFWTCEFESHSGWNRRDDPPYNEYKIILNTMISSTWLVKFIYQHTTTDDKFSWKVELVK